ncbi:hypothetical protein IUQ79_14570 [Mycobacteroides abscessus subsp. bolletii]|uniref:hypothetical protein n=1 Tax=Mycobacteroides abscessus TaxID=36809 RepID=UPI0019D128E9|nr:hypothetical protein [Mycobacteroides abscessus]MBN7303126.1 hypothetical protein [Mycobacteroides abscessus subsp. bolletii]
MLSVQSGTPASVRAMPLHIQPVVLGTLLRQPAESIPTPELLLSVLYGIADPNVPFFCKGDLVEDGVGGLEAAVADGGIQIAALKNELPLNFVVSNIEPVKPGKVRATVLVTGPQLKGVSKRLTFIDQDGWRLQHASAMSLLQATASSQRG